MPFGSLYRLNSLNHTGLSLRNLRIIDGNSVEGVVTMGELEEIPEDEDVKDESGG